MNECNSLLLSYIFEKKESKQSGTKGKDGDPIEKVKARLQVSLSLITSLLCLDHSIFVSLNLVIYVQECGPRFTLKLLTLQHGTFDTKGGEFEWVHKVNSAQDMYIKAVNPGPLRVLLISNLSFHDLCFIAA